MSLQAVHRIDSHLAEDEAAVRARRNESVVARRQDGQWKLAAFQNTRLRPMGPGFAAVLLWNFTDWLWKFLLPKSDVARR